MDCVAENHDRGVDRSPKLGAARLIFGVGLAEPGLDEQRRADDGEKQENGALGDFAKVHGFSITTFIESWSKIPKILMCVLVPVRQGLVVCFL